MAELQSTFLAPARTKLLKQGKREMDALRQEIDAAQAIERVTLDRELTNLNDLQSLIQSLQQLFTVMGIMSTVGGIYLFQLLDRELRQREAQIKTRDSTIDTLTNNIIDGVVILDRSGQIETVNPALIEMFGYTAIDLLECPLIRLFISLSTSKTQPLSSLLTWLEQQPKLGRIWQITAYHRNGTRLPIELSLSEIPQEDRWVAIIRDVSEQAHVMKVIEELLENAVKHHDLDPASDAKGKIMISVRLKADSLEFIICDNGPGIAPEHHQRVFRLFETLQFRDVQENTGIGLAIAKKLVERVGGKIWLENSAAGKGLSVYFTWPQFL
jgi:PAS domain S-box-containing protein